MNKSLGKISLLIILILVVFLFSFIALAVVFSFLIRCLVWARGEVEPGLHRNLAPLEIENDDPVTEIETDDPVPKNGNLRDRTRRFLLKLGKYLYINGLPAFRVETLCNGISLTAFFPERIRVWVCYAFCDRVKSQQV